MNSFKSNIGIIALSTSLSSCTFMDSTKVPWKIVTLLEQDGIPVEIDIEASPFNVRCTNNNIKLTKITDRWRSNRESEYGQYSTVNCSMPNMVARLKSTWNPKEAEMVQATYDKYIANSTPSKDSIPPGK